MGKMSVPNGQQDTRMWRKAINFSWWKFVGENRLVGKLQVSVLTLFSFDMSNTNDGKCVNWRVNIDSSFTWYEVHFIMRKTKGKGEHT